MDHRQPDPPRSSSKGMVIPSMAMQQEPKLDVPIPYIRPIFQAYVREYPHKNMALYGTVPLF